MWLVSRIAQLPCRPQWSPFDWLLWFDVYQFWERHKMKQSIVFWNYMTTMCCCVCQNADYMTTVLLCVSECRLYDHYVWLCVSECGLYDHCVVVCVRMRTTRRGRCLTWRTSWSSQRHSWAAGASCWAWTPTTRSPRTSSPSPPRTGKPRVYSTMVIWGYTLQGTGFLTVTVKWVQPAAE